RPAVIAARQDHVDLVAAERSVLVLPERAGLGMHGEPLRAAMPVGVNLREPALAADQRIVVRHRSVGAQAQHFAAVHVSVLSALLLLTLADRDVQVTVAAESHAPAEIRLGDAPILGDEDLLDVDERAPVETRA